MSILSSLRPKSGSTGSRKRRGRGDGTGLGGTAGKGHKGQKARTGGRVRWGFEGGQTPLMRRTPKWGFNNKDFRTEFEVVNLSSLEKMAAAGHKEVGLEELKKFGLVSHGPVKILGKGTISKPLVVKAHKASASAAAALEKAGGKLVTI